MAELTPRLVGRPLGDLAQLETSRFLLRFETAPFPRLHVAIHPRLSTLHLARRMKAPKSPTELAVAMSRELSGRRVERIEVPGRERLVRIGFEGGRTLVVELMGRASNLLLLDEHDTILRFARTHGGAFRQPVAGERYEPPPPLPAGTTEAAFRSIFRRPGAGAPGGDPAEALPGLSPHLIREIRHREGAGEDPWSFYQEAIRRVTEGPLDPRLYSPAPPESLGESTPLTPRVLFAFPIPLDHAAGLAVTPTATINEAEELATDCLVRHLAYVSLRDSLGTLMRQERRRLGDLIGVLERELGEAREGEGEDRRRGELILAGLRGARQEGSVVHVTDHYDPARPTIRIPIDPRMDLPRNAQRYFRLARRRERTAAMLPGRIEALRQRLSRVEEAARRIQECSTRTGLESLETELQAAGLVRAFRRRERAEVARRPEYVRVKEFRTRDGFLVLVGKAGADNDHLTFRVAAPHDLWLHAAGWPGAHVVVRNPRRLSELPVSTVLEAAGVAAWYSKGKDEKELDVHVAWRRHVRKGRHQAPGMVMVSRHRTVRVAPALPPQRVTGTGGD